MHLYPQTEKWVCDHRSINEENSLTKRTRKHFCSLVLFYTEFRRIYGVVFRTSLRGEAMIHLRIFLTNISLRSSYSEFSALIVDCCFNHRDHNQQKCDKCHLTYYWELSDRSYHNPCYFGETCSKQGAYK